MSVAVLIDYGSGNLRSAEKGLARAAGSLDRAPEIRVTDDPEVIARADRIVLPGVGAFAACMGALQARPGVIEAMTEAVRGGAAFLGVCVGMQLLATRGLEFGATQGLDWIAGEVKRIAPNDPHAKVPHMGWNSLEGDLSAPVFSGLNPGEHMYFTHSYALEAEDEGDVAAWTHHGGRFAAAVARGQYRRRAVPPGKIPGGGDRPAGQLPEVATVILYPAIDLKDGQCVRVLRGDLNQATVFNDDPAAQARAWKAAGFEWLHVIDLNGSVEGRAVNGSRWSRSSAPPTCRCNWAEACVPKPTQSAGSRRAFAA